MSRSEQDALSQDVAFDILSSPRRRYVLYYLKQEDRPVELGELANQIAAWENEIEVEDLTRQQRKRVYVSLYQTHIPKLEDAGIISYEADSGIVELAGRAADIDEYLGNSDGQEFPWQLYYLGLAIVSGLFFAAVWLGISVFGAIPAFVAGFAIIVVFGLSAIAHVLTRR